MAENGPLATTVADAALMLSVLAADPTLAQPADPPTSRIAVSTRVPMTATPLDRHWAAATAETADLLRAAGHAVTQADPPYGQSLPNTEIMLWTAGTELDARSLRDRGELAVRTSRHAAVGKLALKLGAEHSKARDRWRQRATDFFAHRDVLITPALAQPPVPAKAWARRGWLANLWSNARYAPFAAPWNLVGWPAMTVPAGLAPNGLPLAVQLVSTPGNESLLLSLAGQLEQLRPWPRIAAKS
jgi:amidase